MCILTQLYSRCPCKVVNLSNYKHSCFCTRVRLCKFLCGAKQPFCAGMHICGRSCHPCEPYRFRNANSRSGGAMSHPSASIISRYVRVFHWYSTLLSLPRCHNPHVTTELSHCMPHTGLVLELSALTVRRVLPFEGFYGS